MQSVVTPLQAAATADVRQPRISMLASWLKREDAGVAYAIVGSSVINGSDIVQGASSVITNADLFDYIDESDYVMQFEYDRRIEEPRGGISYALANIVLDNISKRFTPNHNATIGTALEARRPIKASVGLFAAGADRMVQVIVGLTSERPRESKMNKTVAIEMSDYITFINNSTLAAAIYEDMRSDEIVESILTSLGFGSTQYVLDPGINTIPFAWFDKTKSAGRRIREICEAEEAHFYQDENGVLRFENRNHYEATPYQTIQHSVDAGDVMYDEQEGNTKIINRAIVIAKPRKVDAVESELWTHGTVEGIAAGASLTIWASFYDGAAGRNILPVKEITTPASGTDYVANAAEDGSGANLTANLTVTVTNFVETAKIVLQNTGGSTLYVTTLQLRGKAARVSQAIQEINEDDNSINKFEAQEYVLENDLIQTRALAATIAANLVSKYSNPMNRRKIKIPGIPFLQLKDLVLVTNPDPVNLLQNPSLELGTDNWSVTGATFTRTSSFGAVDGAYVGQLTIT